MASRDPSFEELSEQVRSLLAAARRQSKGQQQRLGRFLRIVAGMAAAAVLTPLIMLTGGLLLGAGLKSLIATPLAVVAVWAVILYAGLRSRAGSRATADVSPPSQRADSEHWIERQHGTLPDDARRQLDLIAEKLELLAPRLRVLDEPGPAASEARRLIGDDLPALVRAYQKVPRMLRGRPLHGGASPERRLLEGLVTIEDALDQLHAQLAADDVDAFASHQRYLQLKYRRDVLE